jgi:hypothetical protein
MAAIKGITVILLVKKQIGVDAFNAPIYETVETEVENVLVAPSTSDDIVTKQDLTGKKAMYTLAIPKGDTHDWKDATVKFFGQTWKTIGFPLMGIEENIPLDWNKKVTVEQYG